MNYRSRLFLVTADHCIHYDDYEEGRIGKDDKVYVENNIFDKKEWRSILTPWGGFFYFEKLDPQFPEIPDLEDLAFAMHANSFQAPFLTRELKTDNDEIICEANKEKLILSSAAVVDFNKDRYYMCSGVVQNKIVNGMFEGCANALHYDLRFKEYDSDGNAVLECPYNVVKDNWIGISGGPILDDQFHLAGMLIKVSEPQNTIVAVPMRKILVLMDSAIKYEESRR